MDSPFHQDYLDCLEVQYKSLVQLGDTKNMKTLEIILKKVGFSSEKIQQLYIESTLIEGDTHGHLHTLEHYSGQPSGIDETHERASA